MGDASIDRAYLSLIAAQVHAYSPELHAEIQRALSTGDAGDIAIARAKVRKWEAADKLNVAATQSDTTDGPAVGFRWRLDGNIIQETMQPAAWRMVNYLWQQQDRSATFDSLKVPVYEDAEHIADADAFGSLRRAANGYFEAHGVPWRVGIKKTVVSLTAAE